MSRVLSSRSFSPCIPGRDPGPRRVDLLIFPGLLCASTSHPDPTVSQPYIAKTYFNTPNPPVKLAKIAIGNGAMDTYAEYEQATVVRALLHRCLFRLSDD
jgi:hypothetical protein